MEDSRAAIGFKKGGTIIKGEEEYALIWFYDQWIAIPIREEPAGLYSVEIGGECKQFAITNLIMSVNPDLDDLDNCHAGEMIPHEDLFSMFAGFCYSFTGENKYNHVEMRSDGDPGMIQDFIINQMKEDWNI